MEPQEVENAATKKEIKLAEECLFQKTSQVKEQVGSLSG